jgi:hypothetical protein
VAPQTIKIDLMMYLRSVPLLLRHPSILAVPLLAAVVDVLVARVTPVLTDAVGGAGGGIFQMIVQLVYLWAFGIAIVQASNIWRGRRGSFDEAWEEARPKTGGIVLAAIGFQFVVWIASYVGSFVGPLGLILGAAAAFFLIYTIPAAAIGGMPGQLAIQGSIDGVRASIAASIVLAVVFFVIWYVLVPLYLPFLLVGVSPLVWQLVMAAVRALALAYLAFPFAKQYDEVAFRRFW